MVHTLFRASSIYELWSVTRVPSCCSTFLSSVILLNYFSSLRFDSPVPPRRESALPAALTGYEPIYTSAFCVLVTRPPTFYVHFFQILHCRLLLSHE